MKTIFTRFAIAAFITCQSFLSFGQAPVISSILPLAARPDEKVTLTGTNLNFVNEILISNNIINNNSFISQSGDKIEFKFDISTNVFIGQLTVTSSAFTVESSDVFTVLGPATPSVTGISTLTGFPKDIITLTGSGFKKDGNVQKIALGSFSDLEFTILNDNVITLKLPSFTENSVSITSPFTLKKAQNVKSVTQSFDLLFPFVSITGFAPTSGKPGTPITFSGVNLKNIEYLSIREQSQNLFQNFFDLSNAILTPSGQLITQVPGFIDAAFDRNQSTSIFIYSAINNLESRGDEKATVSLFTLLKYPIPSITGVFTPSKIYPDSEITITGFNLSVLNTSKFPIDKIQENSVNVVSDNILIVTPRVLNIKTTITSQIKLYPFFVDAFTSINREFDAQYSLTTTGSYTIHPYDGAVTILGIDKQSYSSTDFMVLTILASGGFNSDNFDFSDNFNKYVLQISEPNGNFKENTINPNANSSFNYTFYNEIFRFKAIKPGINIVKTPILGTLGNRTITVNESTYIFNNDILSGSNYKIRFVEFEFNFNISPPGLNFVSNTITGINYTRKPFFGNSISFSPTSGPAGTVIEIAGYDFTNVSITAVLFNTSIPATSFQVSETKITATVPSGNVFGKIKVVYNSGSESILTEANFNEFINIEIVNPGGKLFTFNPSFDLNLGDSVRVEFKEVENDADLNISIELSSADGSFSNPTIIGTLPKARIIPSPNQFNSNIFYDKTYSILGRIPTNILPSPNYRARILIEKTTEVTNSYSGELFNLTINGNTIVPDFSFTISIPDSLKPVIDSYFGSLPIKVAFAQNNLDSEFQQVFFFSSDTNIAIVEVFYDFPTPIDTTGFNPNPNQTFPGFNPNPNQTFLGINPNISNTGIYFPGSTVFVSGRKDGVVTITGVSIFNPTVTSALVITVTNQSIVSFEILVTDLDGFADSLFIDTLDGSLQLVAKFVPSDIPANLQKVKWSVSDTLLASITPAGLLTGKRNGIVTVSVTSTVFSTIVGIVNVELTNQYEPVVGMTLFADDDSTDIFPKAFEIMPINAGFIPENATNQRYRLQLIQSAQLIVETDTVEHLFEFLPNVNANGTATIIGTSLDNPTVTSTIVIYIIGQEVAASDTITPRFVGSPNAPSNIPNPCEASLELFIDTVGNKYLGFQWYYVSSIGDTAKVVSADKAEFRPVVQGNYFVQAFDSTFNYEYKSFPLTVVGPGRPLVERPGEDDIEADTVLITSEADKYQWFVDGKLIKGATVKELRVYYNGLYYVSIADAKNCRTISDKFVFERPDFVDIARADLYGNDSTIENYGKPKNSLKLYPNPAADEFTIQYQSASNRTVYASLYNTFGQEVATIAYPYTKNKVRLIKIPVTGINSGMYFVKVTDGEEVSKSKILIK